MITKSGAEYAYLIEAGKVLPNQLAPVPAFLFAWVSVFILKPALFGVIALSFGIYTVEPFFPNCEVPDGLVKLIAIICMCKSCFIQMPLICILYCWHYFINNIIKVLVILYLHSLFIMWNT